MRLQRLTGLERDKILAELKELREKIARYKAILADEKLVYAIIREELLEVRKAYADERRTEIIPAEAEVTIEDLIADEDMVITISNQDYIKRNSVTLLPPHGAQHPGRQRDGDEGGRLRQAAVHRLDPQLRAVSSRRSGGCTGSRCTRSSRRAGPPRARRS